MRLCAITREGEVAPVAPIIAPDEQKNFDRLLSYYFPGIEHFIKPTPKLDTLILTSNQPTQLLQWLGEAGAASGQLQLVYRASVHGWSGSDFHSHCDNKGATVTIIKTTDGYVFGGYTDVAWNSVGSWQWSDKAFLFALHCHSGLPPTRMALTGNSNQHAMFDQASYGPRFGGGVDLSLGDNSNIGNSSAYNIGASYRCPPGQTGNTFLTGGNQFEAKEVEVFSVSLLESGCLRNVLPVWRPDIE